MTNNDETAGPADRELALSDEDIARLPEDLRLKFSGFQIQRSFEMVRSPLLPPRILEEYDQIIPGLSEKLISWTEEETSHRREMEKSGFGEIKTFRKRGQFFGLTISALGILGSVIVGIFSPADSFAGTVAAAVIVLAAIGGPVAVRVFAENYSKKRTDDTE